MECAGVQYHGILKDWPFSSTQPMNHMTWQAMLSRVAISWVRRATSSASFLVMLSERATSFLMRTYDQDPSLWHRRMFDLYSGYSVAFSVGRCTSQMS